MFWPFDRAPGLVLMGQPVVSPSVTCGENVVVHGETTIGDHSQIGADSVLGKPVPAAGEVELSIGQGVTVGTQSVICAGAHIGNYVLIGDHGFIRAGASIGDYTELGQNVSIESGVSVGSNVKIGRNTNLTIGCKVEDEVVIGNGVTTTNDDTIGRHPPEVELQGPTFCRGSRVGDGAILTPGVIIGEEAMVAAGSIVTRDVPPKAVVRGTPAQIVDVVPTDELLKLGAPSG